MINVHDSDIEIGLLPVPLVLFPGGKLKITVASAQDQDLLGRSLKDAMGVGLVLSEQQVWVNDGSTDDVASTAESIEETRAQSHPEIASVGTYCEILDFDQNAKGQLEVVLTARQKLKILDAYEDVSGGLRAECRLLEPEPSIPVGPEDELLVGILEDLLAHPGVAREARQPRYEHAAELGGRLVELLPIKNAMRQRFLELSDPLARLTRIERMLDEIQKEKGISE